MASNTKIALSFLLIVIALGAVYFTFRNAIPNFSFEKNNNENNLKGLSASSTSELTSGSGYFSKINMTKLLSDSFFTELNTQEAVNSVKGDAGMGIGTISQNVAEDVIKNAQADLNFVVVLNDWDIFISQDNSKSNKEEYFKKISSAINKNFSVYRPIYLQVIVDVYQKLDSTSAQKAAEVYRNLAKDFQTIAVPSDWKETHKKMIIYYKNSEIVYRAMANYQQDPIKGYLALDMIESLVEESPDIQAELVKRANEIGIK